MRHIFTREQKIKQKQKVMEQHVRSLPQTKARNEKLQKEAKENQRIRTSLAANIQWDHDYNLAPSGWAEKK